MDNGKSEFITKKIKAYGIVQGVGFRPLVYRIAKKLGIRGTVRNVGGYVEILVSAGKEVIEAFLQELRVGQDSGYEIVKLEIEEHPQTDYEDFIIVGSGVSEEVSIIPPDLPVCASCQKELFDETDRRYRNPFISCMSCGPRYTIIDELPYDRHNTTMKDYKMCADCHEEYTMPEHRRFHAQTISCNDCGPYLIYHQCNIDKPQTGKKAKTTGYATNPVDTANPVNVTNPRYAANPTDATNSTITDSIKEQALMEAAACIKSGGVIAVKGIGGYHLVCSPFEEETVRKLRKLKGREEKPFAVMFETLRQIEEYCLVSEEERALLETKARPIVLLYLHTDSMAPSTNKGSMYCGAFLPYTPLQLLLIRECGPLIMTSANFSGKPIIREDEVMLSLNSPYLDGILYNTRRIVRSVDDSVAKVIDGKPQLIRRSRGYVPYPVFISETSKEQTERLNEENSEEVIRKNREEIIQENKGENIKEITQKNDTLIFAAGGDLKAAFCLYRNGGAVLSQYFGDLEEESVMEEYQKSFTDLTRLLMISPSLAVCDLHPNYYSTGYAKSLGIPLLQVQHHHAHIASVMAEHDLKGPVIGIALDGTGYGTDGNVWGGEFLVCEGAEFIRAAHFKYTPMLGGDESMRDAKKTATCFLLEAGLEEQVRDERKAVIKAALAHKVNTVQSSSVGRLFDAVASILDIRQVNRYEGECAAFLEREAQLAVRDGKEPAEISFAITLESEIIQIDPTPILKAMCLQRDTIDTGALALGFHYAMAEVILKVCEKLREKYQSNIVAISGGVFQNTILSETSLKLLRQSNFQVYGNLAVPPNDGGISLGQAYIGRKKLTGSREA